MSGKITFHVKMEIWGGKKVSRSGQLALLKSSWVPFCVWHSSKAPKICATQTICLSDIISMIQTDFKCQLREVSEVISWETVTVCSITSSLSHHCNPRIRCNDTLFPHISMKCTGFHPCDHIHMYRSDTIMDDLAGSLSAHTHTPP